MKGPREKLLYFPCVPVDSTKRNYLCTVDADPESETYSQVYYAKHIHTFHKH